MVEIDKSQPNKELSPGEILLEGRLQAGLTQEQVAKELYMTVDKVNALETDNYSRLSSDTFARGYIRAYANLVKVDIASALAAYDKLINDIKPATPVQHQQVAAAENSHRGAWQFLAVIGAFFIGLWLISVWFFDNRSESEYSVLSASSVSAAAKSLTAPSKTSSMSSSVISAPDAETALDPARPADNVNASSATQPLSMSTAQSNASTLSSAREFNASSVAAVENVVASVKKTSLDEITFSFRGECWLEVSDSRGDVLATELEPAGSKIKLVGLAPFDVKLGNAPAVDIQLNGKKIDVIPLMGTNVLTLKVDD